MATYQKFNQFVEDLAEKVHNLGSDTLKVLLTLTAPVAANSIKTDLTEIASTNGYLAQTPAISSSVQTSGTYKLVLADVVFTASGGSFANFRYAVLWNDTPAAPLDPLIGFFDYGATLTLTDGNSFTVDFSAANGVIQLV